MLINYFKKLFYCLIFFSAAVLASSSQETVNIISISDLEIVFSVSASAEIITSEINSQTLTQIGIPSEGFVGEAGMPDLPAITRVLTFPADGELHIEIIQDDVVEIDLIHPLTPFTVDDNNLSNSEFQFGEEKLFPANIVEVSDQQLFRGHRLYPITIYPYQYDHERQKIIHHNELTIAVRFEAADDQSNVSQPVTMTIDTYRFLNALTMNGPQRDDGGAGLPRGGYLIATSFSENNVGESVERLADWKRACGHQVEILYGYNNIIGTATTFRRDEIEPRYEEWDPPLEFACVIGTFIEQNRNTDVTYGCLDGNNDHVPEVAVARLGAASRQQVNTVISRALSYQQEPWTEELDWFNRAGAHAYNVGRSHLPSVDHTITWIAKAESRAGFPEVVWHSADGGNQGSPNTWLRDGLSVIFTRGLDRQQLPNFSNLEFNSMWISSGGGHVPAYVDQFWNNGSSGPSVMTGTGHNPQTLHCNVIVGGMARGLVIERLPLGWARAFALLMLDYSEVGGWGQFATEYRVMGEPGQRTWIGAPLQPEVTHAEFIVAGQNRFDVTVMDPENEAGVPNALVTLIQPGELLTSGLTDENGICVLTIDEEFDDDVLLTITKEAVLPYQAEIEVRESHLFVRGFISMLNDEENGNGDGVLNPGETAEITLAFENLSDDEDSENVVGLLSVNSSWLTIDESEFNLGDLEPNEEIEFEETLTITLDPSAPESASLGLSVILSSGEANWISRLFLEIEGAELELYEVEGGIIFEPELTDLNITLINEGSVGSPAMAAELVSPTQWIQIINSQSEIDEIEPGETGEISGDPFVIKPSPIAPSGLTAPLLLLLRANEEDIPDTILFILQISTRRESSPNGPDDYGYICFDDTDEDWDQAPEYNWVEINPNERNPDFRGEELPGNRRDNLASEVELPFEFQYYGEQYNHIAISENGFIAMGEDMDLLKQYENFPLDMIINGSLGMIAPYWDDLKIRVGDANIYTFYDDDGHTFIIQWQELGFVNGGNGRVTFEVILFDPAYFPSVSGDGSFLIQYKTVPDPIRGVSPYYFSAGICSPDGSTGINYAYMNDYPTASAPIENQRALFYTTSAEAPRGKIYGTILDVETGQAMPGAFILTSYGQEVFTNEQGEYVIPDAWGLPFDVTADKQGWNDSTLTGFDLEEGDSIEINFALLHPEFDPSALSLERVLQEGSSSELEFSVHNTGNGPLNWNVDRRLFGEANAEPWEFRHNYMFGEQVEDPGLYGVIFIDDHFYVSGSNDDAPTIYIFDREGAPVDTFAQPGDHRLGMKDLTYDGELLWGTVGDTTYGMTLEGEVMRSFVAPGRTPSVITWDPDRELLWIGGTTENIIGMDRDGNQVEGMEIRREGLRIYGLAYFADDQDDAPLYISHRENVSNRHLLHKHSFETGEKSFVAYLDLDLGGRPQGAFITNQFDVYSWIFITMSNDAGRDRVDIWQIEGRKDWFMLDIMAEDGRIEAAAGQLQTNEIMDFILTLDATGLPDTLFQSELYFSHDADSGIGHITIDLEVETFPLPEFGLIEPEDGDTLTSSEVEFGWNSIYDPNREARYVIWAKQGIDSTSIALTDTSFTVLLDTLWNEINYALPVNWWVQAVLDGDSTECDLRYSFILNVNVHGDNPQNNPYVFKLNSAYPNPFNDMTNISFELDKSNHATLSVIDILGREVMMLHQGRLAAGRYNMMWDAGRFASGVYLIKLESADNVMIRKVLLMK